MLILLLAGLGFNQASAQTTTNLCDIDTNVAWFGVDGDLYANSPNSPLFYNSDDWFFDPADSSPGNNQGLGVISTGLSSAVSSSGETLIQKTAADFNAYLQTPGFDEGDRNVRFEERMSVPSFDFRVRGGDVIVYLDAVAGRDNFSTASTNDSSMFAGNGNKNGDNPLTWSLGVGNVPQKNDLIDVGGHIRYLLTNPGTPAADTLLFGYAFATRMETNGDNHIDFEIFRNADPTPPKFLPVPSGGTGNPINTGPSTTGGHIVGYVDATGNVIQPGDVLIAVDYGNGGTNPTYSVRVWVKPDSLGVGINSFASWNDTIAHPNVPFLFTGPFDSGTGANGYGYAEIKPRRSSAGECLVISQTNVNNSTRPTPWGAIANPGAEYQTQLQTLQLVSVCINFAAFGLDATRGSAQQECANLFGSLLVKTRSSGSFTASLKDYTGPYLFGNFSLLDVTAQGGTITCDNPTATLTADIEGPGTPIITWSPSAGIVSGQGTNQIVVNQPGVYTITVSDPGFANCTKTADATAVDGRVYCNVTCPNDISLNCNNPTGTLSIPTLNGCEVRIRKPDGTYTTSAINFDETNGAAGTYYLVARNIASGCKDSCDVVVTKDFTRCNVTCPNDITLNCNNPTATLSIPSLTGCTVKIRRPDGSYTTSAINFDETNGATGTYYLVAQNNTSGCKDSCDVVVSKNFTRCNVTCPGDIDLSCSNPTASIAIPNLTGCSVVVRFPNGSTSATTVNLDLNSATGTYYLVATNNASGCKDSCDIVVTKDFNVCNVQCPGDIFLNCDNPTASITIPSLTGCTVKIRLPNGTYSTSTVNLDQNSATGTYYLVAENNTSGCKDSCDIVVTKDFTVCNVQCPGDIFLSCDNPTSSIAIPSLTGCSVKIRFPNGTYSTTTVNLNSTSATGTYYLVAENNTSGCKDSCDIVVSKDFTVCNVSCPGDIFLSCDNPTSSIAIPSLTGCSVKIRFPNGTYSTTTVNLDQTSATGTYYLVAQNNTSGCKDSCDVVVTKDFTVCNIQCPADINLNCNNPTATLSIPSLTGCTVKIRRPDGSYSTSAINFDETNGATGTYYLVAQNTTSGCKDSCDVVVSKNFTRCNVTCPGDIELSCTNPTASIAIPNLTGCSVVVRFPNGSTSATTVNLDLNSATGTYYLVATNNASGCKDSCDIVVTKDFNVCNVQCPGDIFLNCDNPTASITIPSLTGCTVKIRLPNGTYSTSTVNLDQNSATGTYYLVAENNTSGCKDSCDIVVTKDFTVCNVQCPGDIFLNCDNPTSSIAIPSLTGCSVKIRFPNGTYSTTTVNLNSTSATGTYYLVAENNTSGCKDSCDIVVSKDFTVCNVSCPNDIFLNCDNPTASITIPSLTGCTVKIRLPNGTYSTSTVNLDQNSATGTYYLVAENNTSGCKDSCDIAVTKDFTVCNVTCPGDIFLNCDNPTASIAIPSLTGCTVKIRLPNGTYSTTTVNLNSTSATGTYYLVAENNTSGCKDSCDVVVSKDFTVCNVQCPGDITLNCNNPTATLSIPTLTGCTVKIRRPDGSYSTSAINFTETSGAAGTYYLVAQNNTSGCKDSCDVVVTKNFARPVCGIATPAQPTCGSTGNTLTSTSTGATSYLWRLISGTGYSIPGSTSGSSVTYTAGSGPATFRLVVENTASGCKDSCEVTVNAVCGRFCTYTQGFYGGGGQSCNGLGVVPFIAQLIGSNPLVLGGGAYSLTITAAEAACLNQRMPGGGLAAQLGGVATCTTPTGIAIRNGRFHNVLVGQAVALGLNLRINNGALASQRITGMYLTTYASTGTGCGSNGTAIAGTGQTFVIPQAVINYLGANNTVGDLFMLASRALGRSLPASPTPPTLSQIVSALDAINRGFDECRILGTFSNTPPVTRMAPANEEGTVDALEANGIVAKAFPNPFTESTTIEFVMNDYTSSVTVEVYNLNGEKVASLYNGEANGGEVKRVEFNATMLANGIYVYRITTGDNVYYDKLILNR